MKIELKSLRIYERMSEETIAFTADLFVNGKKVAYAKNDGCGGSTFYHPYPQADKQLLDAAEIYCQKLPEKEGFSQNLEDVIDDWVYRVYNEKIEKKAKERLAKDCIKGICFGVNENSYKILSWKGFTIPSLLTHSKGLNLIKEKIKELKTNGENILNKNIPQELFVD